MGYLDTVHAVQMFETCFPFSFCCEWFLVFMGEKEVRAKGMNGRSNNFLVKM